MKLRMSLEMKLQMKLKVKFIEQNEWLFYKNHVL